MTNIEAFKQIHKKTVEVIYNLEEALPCGFEEVGARGLTDIEKICEQQLKTQEKE